MTRSQPFTAVGYRLRCARESFGVSLDELARRSNWGKTTLAYFEQGRRPISTEVIDCYEQHLGVKVDLDPIATVEYVGRADVDRRSFIRSAAYTASFSALALVGGEHLARVTAHAETSTAGAETITAIRGVTDSFIYADETLGGGIGRTAVAEYLATDVAAVLKGQFASQEVRSSAFSAAAEVAYLAGFKAHDSGFDGLAQRYYLAALELAEESGDTGHQAFVLRILALQGCDVGQQSFSVPLAEAALERARHSPIGADTEALFHITLARCQAETGEARPAATTIARTPALSPDTIDEAPRWAAQWCPSKATLLNQTAKTHTATGDLTETAGLLDEVTRLWDRQSKARVWALAMADLGHARWDLGDTTAATGAWDAALPTLEQIDSDRTAKAAAKIRNTIAGAGAV